MKRRTFLRYAALAGVVGLVGLPELAYGEAMTYKLGKTPASNSAKLKLSAYLDWDCLPLVPPDYGHETLVHDWQMLGNDEVGDCAIAGPMHALMLWNAEAGKTVNVDTACTLRAYSAITGYDPKDPSTDQGSNVQDVAEYWRSTGLTDADGKVHKIDGYVALQPGNVHELFAAMYLFDGVGIGVQLPSQWITAFDRGQIWDVPRRAVNEGGHYVLGVGRRNGDINVVTWGKTQLMTPAAYHKFSDEAFAYFSEEKLVNGKTLEGFDKDQLLADFRALGAEKLS